MTGARRWPLIVIASPAAFAALWLGLSVLKRIMHPDPGAPGIPDADVPPDDEDTVPETDPLMVSAEAAYPDVVYAVQANPSSDPLLVSAEAACPDVLTGAPAPSLRSIRGTLRVGDRRARLVRDHLERKRPDIPVS